MTQQKPAIKDHVSIPLSDGRTLSARIWMPETHTPQPAIVEAHPYPKTYATAQRDEINHGWFAQAGYVSLRIDIAGCGESDGVIVDQYRQDEHAAIIEALNWVAGQDWCDGNIGMFGHSWGAFSGIQISARAPDCLKAVVMTGASDNLYTEDCHFRGGVMAAENMGWAATMLSFFSRPPTRVGSGPDWREKWVERMQQSAWILSTWLGHQIRDEYWHQGSVSDDYSRVSVPVLAASGWADTYCTSVMRMAEHMPDSYKGVIGPWAHKFPHMGMPGPAIGWLQECKRWWDHWLRGVDNGVETLPRLRSWLSEDVVPDALGNTTRKGRWVSDETWPTPAVEGVKYPLGRGTLGAGKSNDSIVLSSPQTTGIAGGELMPMGWGADLPGDQQPDDGQSLVFDTPVLEAAVDMLGRATVELTFTSDKPVAFVVARICDVRPDGQSYRVCYGAHNLTHSPDHAEVIHLEPGKQTRVKFQMDAMGHRFLKGHKIRLSLSNAYWPLLWPSPEKTCLTVELGQSALTLPVRHRAVEPEVAFEPAQKAEPLPREVLEPALGSRVFTSDLASGFTTCTVTDFSGKEHSPQSGITTWGNTTRIYKVHKDRPETATMTSDRETNLDEAGHHLKTRAYVEMTCDAECYYTTASLTAWDNDVEVFHRTWSDASPRNGT